ncbi:MAG: FtsX-like permease family protein [Planctomycetota bacterium]
MYRLYLAFRFLLRRPINALGVIGVMLGVWALIVVPSIFSGYIDEVGKHLQSSVSDVSANNLPRTADFAKLERVILSDPNVSACAPRIVWQGLLHPKGKKARLPTQDLGSRLSETPLVSLLGLDPTREGAVTEFRDWAEKGGSELDVMRSEPPEGSKAKLFLSRDRAAREGLQVGDTAVISIGRFEGSLLDEKLILVDIEFEVAGLYESSYAAFDALNVWTSLPILRKELRQTAKGWVNEFAISLKNPKDAEATAARLSRTLNDEFGTGRNAIRVRSWAQANAAQLSSIEHQRGLLRLVLFIIVVVSAFLVFATLSMMVTEKTRDIGTMTAMGADAVGISSLFMTCGFAITVLGVVLGTALGATTAVYLNDVNEFARQTFDVDLFPTRIYNLREVPYRLELEWILMVCGVSLVLGVLVALVPAWRAGRQDPLAPLRAD